MIASRVRKNSERNRTGGKREVRKSLPFISNRTLRSMTDRKEFSAQHKKLRSAPLECNDAVWFDSQNRSLLWRGGEVDTVFGFEKEASALQWIREKSQAWLLENR
jgi:hypothetical protein